MAAPMPKNDQLRAMREANVAKRMGNPAGWRQRPVSVASIEEKIEAAKAALVVANNHE